MAMALHHLPCTSHALPGCVAPALRPACCSRKNNNGVVITTVRASDHRMHVTNPTRGGSVACGSAPADAAGSSSTTTTTTTGGVTEVDKDTFWPFVKEAGEKDKLVVLDMYTQWCGPCKLMFPKVVVLSETYDDVVFAKLDCNQENKALAKELGVKTVPTFKIFQNEQEVAEVRGAKYDDLVSAIENARSSSTS